MARITQLPRRSSLVIAAALTLGSLSTASGQATYVGPALGQWNVPAHWSTGVIPGSLINVTIDASAADNVVNVPAGSFATNLITITPGDTLRLDSGATMLFAGDINNAGTILFNTGGTSATMQLNAGNVISGPGVIDFGSSAGGLISSSSPTTAVNNSTIRGGGRLDNIFLTNSGLIENYNTTNQLILDSNNGGADRFVNTGVIRALAGSTVTFTGDFGGNFLSTGGSIQANGTGAIVRFVNSASVTGGSYSTTGGGEIQVQAGQTAFASPQSLSGTLRVGDNATLYLNGTMTNNGAIRLTTAGNASVLNVNAPLTLNGTGSLVGEWSGAGAGPRIDAPSHMMTIGANQTQSGVIHYNNSRVTNNGLIDANVASAAAVGAGIIIDPNNQGPNLIVNNGTMRSSAGGLLGITGDFGGETLNNGTISAIGAGSITELYNGALVTGGTWSNSVGGVIRVRPGHTGTLVGPVTITSGSKFTVATTATQNATLNTSGTFTGHIELQANGQAPNLNLLGTTTLTSGSLLRGTYVAVTPTSPGPRIDAVSHTLTIASGATVDGVVYFQNSRVINNGTIDSNTTLATSNGGMYIDPSNAAADLFVNNGTMRSSNGGLMQLTGDFGGNFLNNGTISATGTDSITELVNSVTVTGGTWSNSNGGTIRVRPANTATLVGPVTIAPGSKFTVPSTTTQTTTLNTSGSFAGHLELQANGQAPNLNLTGPTTLTSGSLLRGTYVAVTPTSPGPRIDAVNHTLTIATGATVDGVVYFQNSRVINNGLIDANHPAGMYVDPNNQAPGLFINNGLMRSSGAGVMVLTGDNGPAGNDFLNNGTISSTGAGSVTELFNTATVIGGTWSNTNGGTIRVRPGQTASLVSPTISAGSTFVVEGNSGVTTRLNLNTSLTGPGTLELRSNNPGGNRPVLSVANNLTLNAGSVVWGSYDTTGNGASIEAFNNTLTVASGAIVRGVVYFNNSRVINNGTILSDNPAVPNTVGSFGMYIDSSNAGPGLFVNNGTIRATNGASLGFTGDNGGTFTGTGPLIVDANSVIGTWNSAAGDMGPVSGAGTYRAGNSANLGHVHFRVGALEATNSGIVRITAGGGEAGTSVTGSILLNTSGRIDLTDNGLIVDYTGTSPEPTIRGYLASGFNGGQWNGANGIGSSLALNNGRAVGYAEASALGLTSFLGQTVDDTSLLMRYTVVGDANLDGSVDFADLLRLAQNFEEAVTGRDWALGDFNYDGRTNFADLLSLSQNFGSTLLADGSVSTELDLSGDIVHHWAVARSLVPEPATLGLVAVGLLALARRR